MGCLGLPVACDEIYPGPECESQQDCSIRADCAGDRVACNMYDNQTDCIAHLCGWDTLSDACFLTSGKYFCSDYDEQECAMVEGCALENHRCQGEVAQCSTLEDLHDCAAQIGCDPTCGGTAQRCEEITDELSCTTHDGCDWS